jgi:Arc/MetJ-type ribon-helix-helix transcriptional regulator
MNESMNIILNPELEKLVVEKVRSGEYETPEAVVQEALHKLGLQLVIPKPA